MDPEFEEQRVSFCKQNCVHFEVGSKGTKLCFVIGPTRPSQQSICRTATGHQKQLWSIYSSCSCWDWHAQGCRLACCSWVPGRMHGGGVWCSPLAQWPVLLSPLVSHASLSAWTLYYLRLVYVQESCENKLIYTQLFHQYTELVEAGIESRLRKAVDGFDMQVVGIPSKHLA